MNNDKISLVQTNRQSKNWLTYDIIEKYLIRASGLYKGDLYDLGCGEALYRDFFLLYVKKYIGVDWVGSYHATKADIVADLNKPLPIDSEVADTVVSLAVLEHLLEPQMMLNEAYRILKPGGAIVLQVPWQWWIHEAPYDYFRYTPYGLRYLFEKAGFSEITVEPQSGYFTTAVLKLNYFTSRFTQGANPLNRLIKGCLIPFWFLGQKFAPFLDRLDRNWELETLGYFVTARKL